MFWLREGRQSLFFWTQIRTICYNLICPVQNVTYRMCFSSFNLLLLPLIRLSVLQMNRPTVHWRLALFRFRHLITHATINFRNRSVGRCLFSAVTEEILWTNKLFSHTSSFHPCARLNGCLTKPDQSTIGANLFISIGTI